MHPWMSQQPLFGRFIFVDVQVVQHDVKFAERIRLHHVVHKTEKVHCRSAIADMCDYLAGSDLQSRQQRLRAVTDVFVGPGARLFGPQGQ